MAELALLGVPHFQIRLKSRNCMKKVGVQCCCTKHSITYSRWVWDNIGLKSCETPAYFWNLFQPQPACCYLEYLQHQSQRRSLGKVDFSPYIKPLQKIGTTSPEDKFMRKLATVRLDNTPQQSASLISPSKAKKTSFTGQGQQISNLQNLIYLHLHSSKYATKLNAALFGYINICGQAHIDISGVKQYQNQISKDLCADKNFRITNTPKTFCRNAALAWISAQWVHYMANLGDILRDEGC